jgi:hypothetical protein
MQVHRRLRGRFLLYLLHLAPPLVCMLRAW